MPSYDYLCEANGRIVEVKHGINRQLLTWSEVCECAAIDCGDTDPSAPVHKVLSAPAVVTSVGHADLKNRGFTKLVKREAGVYENVTATDGEARYVKADNPATMPHLHKKIGD
ncbi:MAG: zinc ribbon domain-containing protein [Candidatus Competibacterales bacterium]